MDSTKTKYVMTAHHGCVVSTILAEAIEKLQLLAMISNDTKSRGHQKRSKTDMHVLLQRRAELETRYYTMMKRRNALRGLHNRKKYHNNQEELQQLANQLCQSIKTISQNLSESNNPHLSKNLLKVEKDRNMLADLLKATVDELEDGSSFGMIVKQVNTQLEEVHNLAATKAKRAQIQKDLKDLEIELKNEWEVFEKDVMSREKKISKLTMELQHLATETQFTEKYESDTAEASANTSKRLIRQKLKAIDRDIDEAKAKLNLDKKVGESTMKFLQDRQERMDSKKSEWESKYKQDKREWRNKLDDLHEERDYDKAQLDALRARKEKNEKEEADRLESEKFKDTKLIERREEEKRQYIAASKIRFFWKVFWGKQLKSKGKKKKKKKSKK
eukprot:CAMPEP_0197517694 /NCGR_PEP_ID=MMETSP1318-20131121/2756_1 /TAXON_ID=552666 /ORGANISM="Partenskyella glossopodia, Strain RCC365" /LENGTH=387 /DNA_ID=CAMNT_0043067475 /DNA_START=48 /DNA_END=1211 /DNA_ORIENTATION=-